MYLIHVISGLCGMNRPAYMLAQEGFSEQDDMLAYYTRIEKGANAILKRCETATERTQTIRDKFSELGNSICEVSRQIDDGLLQNYMSNVPVDEYSLPANIQKERAAVRKTRAGAYVQSQRDAFSKSYESPLLECFADESELSSRRDSVVDLVNSADSAVSTLEKNLEKLSMEIPEITVKKNYATLAYNDKYIKSLKKAMAEARTEGFQISPSTQVLTFGPPPAPPQGDPTQEMGLRLSNLGEKLSKLEGTMEFLYSNVTIFNNTATLQNEQIKQTRNVGSKFT